MSGSEKAGNGRGNNHGNNRRRPFRRRDRDNNARQEVGGFGEPRVKDASPNRASAEGSDNQGRQNRTGFSKRGGENPRGEKVPFFERPKWVPPKINNVPLPVPDCPWCGKPIRDISLAIADKDTGAPVHFECVAARITGGENLEKDEVVTYIGGGRFGVVCFDGHGDPNTIGRCYKIKKIIEWENKEKRAEWRSAICEHYSII